MKHMWALANFNTNAEDKTFMETTITGDVDYA